MSDTLIEKMLSLPEFRVTDFKQNDNDMAFTLRQRSVQRSVRFAAVTSPIW